MPNVFGIADDNLFAGFDEQGQDYDETVEKILWLCRQANLKLNKDKCLFRCTKIRFFGSVMLCNFLCVCVCNFMTRCKSGPKKGSSYC